MNTKIQKFRSLQHIHCSNCPSRDLCIAPTTMDPAIVNEINAIIHKIIFLKKKEHLFYSYTHTKYIYAVYKGSCKEYWVDSEGNECLTNFYLPGDLAGIESAADQTHQFSVAALEDSEICVIPFDELYKVMEQHPVVLKRFMSIVSLKVRNDQSLKMGVTADERVSDFLLNIITRMLERDSSLQSIPLPMSQLDISSFLGLTPETVNRILKKLQQQKIIKIKNKNITVLNFAELGSLARFKKEDILI